MERSWGFAIVAGLATLSSLYYLGSSLMSFDDSVGDFAPAFDRNDETLYRPSILTLVELTKSEAPSVYPPLHGGEFRTDDYSNFVVIPDIHGDAKNFIISLWIAVKDVENSSISLEDFERLINKAAAEGKYPETPLFPETSNIAVSLGDLVDRGPDSILCLRILWSIQRVIGWPLVSVYGNHEIMSHSAYANDYIHRNEIVELGSIRNRNKIFARSSPLWNKLASESLLMGRFVAPFSLTSSSPSKRSVLFNHAGPEPSFIARLPEDVAQSVDRLNQLAQLGVTSNDTSGDPWLSLLMNNEQSPVWSRVLTNNQMDQRVLCDEILPHVLQQFGVGRLVLGHTPQYDHRMKSLCQGRIILADCAISKYMDDDEGQPAVLVMKNHNGALGESEEFDEVYALYYSFNTGSILKEPLVKPPRGGTTARPSIRRSPRMVQMADEEGKVSPQTLPPHPTVLPARIETSVDGRPSASGKGPNPSPVSVDERWTFEDYAEALGSLAEELREGQ